MGTAKRARRRGMADYLVVVGPVSAFAGANDWLLRAYVQYPAGGGPTDKPSDGRSTPGDSHGSRTALDELASEVH